MDEIYLTVEQIAETLQVSESWVYKKCKAKIIPCFRLGGIIRFSRKQIDEWIKAQTNRGVLKI